MKKVLLLAITLMTLGLSLALTAHPVVAAANDPFDPLGGVCQQDGAKNSSACTSKAAQGTDIISSVIRIMSYAAGVAAVILIIIAGLQFITSSGDSQGVANARRAVLGAVIGLIVVALAQAILHFVLNRTAPTP